MLKPIAKFLMLLVILISQVAFGVQVTPSLPQEKITKHIWNLQDADIKAVINAIASETHKSFIIDPRVEGKISIVSTTPIDNKAAYQVFLSALQVLGYSAVPSGKVIKIVPDMNARSMAYPLANDAQPGSGDELVVKVIPIKNVSAIQLVPILRPLMPEWDNLAAYAPSNTLIIAGRAANVERLQKIVNRVDIANSSAIEVIPVYHASAPKIVAAITALQAADRANGKVSNVSIAADDESNKILLSGNSEDRIRLRVLISQLDSEQNSGGTTRVIHLNYIDAKTLAPILAAISHSSYATTASKTQPQMTLPETQTSDTAATNTQVAVRADIATNSIVISAPPSIMNTLISVIHQLDTQPSQVLVEAVIAQVDESMMRQLGVTWGTVNENDDDSSSSMSDDTASSALGFQSGVGIIKSGNIRVLINALMNNTSSDILSTPSIVVLDNQKAEIKVGKNVGMVNREYAVSQNDNSYSPYNTIERKDVALILNVTPHISPNDNIRLKLKQTNDTLQNPADPSDNPVLNTNLINTAVMVHDGDILVLGGLISHDLTSGDSKVPILGDLPIVGEVFHYKNKQLDKKNLMVFIRPIVLRRNVNERQITEDRYNYLRHLQLLRGEGVGIITNVNEPPVLETLHKPKLQLPQPFRK